MNRRYQRRVLRNLAETFTYNLTIDPFVPNTPPNTDIYPSSKIIENYINELIYEYINHTNFKLTPEDVKETYNYFNTTENVKRLKLELVTKTNKIFVCKE